ncbi:cobyric acid synthase [Actinopolymorpha sp. B17G11]|uniref:cobyric acid synthase n=1 Tax=Actinopolymorpha sp. B17G11 TaxID=3160861 RepID=UPI0032E4D1E3
MSGVGLLVAGTTSDAGKSVVTTALCRAFARRGLRVAPYKAQNMSNNSMVTAEGAEIGRAQWVQAVAAGAEPEAAMNPVLLKPGSDRSSHVVVMGRSAGRLEAGEFAVGRQHLARAAFDAFDDLRGRYDVVVCEGAGSPAEINLRVGDYVNLGLARHAGMPAVVVGDIDRGGVFASFFGTVALLEAADQALVAGFVVNKFRGDVGLLRPGLVDLERMTGRRVYGVLPWIRDLWLDAEDALALEERARPGGVGGMDGSVGDTLQVAVVRFPRISNFTDVDALAVEPGLAVRFVDDPRSLAGADVVVLPGTRSTLADLEWLHQRGLARAVADHAAAGGVVLGICGGFQMLGRSITDPDGVEGRAGAAVSGLGLLDADTCFEAHKVVRLCSGEALGAPASGYEIHHGRVTVSEGEAFLGGARRGTVFGTLWHGIFEADALRRAWLTEVARLRGADGFKPGSASFAQLREERIDRLADTVEEHLDVDALLALARNGAPAGIRTIRGGMA